VAGFHAWNDLGRRASKGAKAIRILAPMPLRDREEEAGEDDEVRVLFKSVAVFDTLSRDRRRGARERDGAVGGAERRAGGTGLAAGRGRSPEGDERVSPRRPGAWWRQGC